WSVAAFTAIRYSQVEKAAARRKLAALRRAARNASWVASSASSRLARSRRQGRAGRRAGGHQLREGPGVAAQVGGEEGLVPRAVHDRRPASAIPMRYPPPSWGR